MIEPRAGERRVKGQGGRGLTRRGVVGASSLATRGTSQPRRANVGASSLATRGTSLRRRGRDAFTLLEILLALALVSLVLVAMNSFIFSMGELWGRNTDLRLFEQHVRAVTRFLENELRSAALPPAARANSSPFAMEEVRPQSGMMENMLTFELPSGSRLFTWPEQPLPEVVCSFQARPNEGLVMLWHSRLEKNFETDPPREVVVTPLVSGLTYDYWDAELKRWTTETQVKMDSQNRPMTPNRLRLKFAYNKLTRESVVTLPVVGQALPAF